MNLFEFENALDAMDKGYNYDYIQGILYVENPMWWPGGDEPGEFEINLKELLTFL